MQLLDDGRLTDGQGRTVDFRNTVIIMTSNLGGDLWSGHDKPVQRDDITRTLQAHFKPEFLNRIDDIVVFHSLTRKDIAAIVGIQLQRVAHLLADKGYPLEVTPAAQDWLGETGYDPDYGARPLKRAIQRELQDPLAIKILAGDFRPGETILVDKGETALTFTPVIQPAQD